MVDEDLPTLPMYYYNTDELASDYSGSDSERYGNEGYVDNEEGVPVREDVGAEGAEWECSHMNDNKEVGSRTGPVAGWHVNPAFYLNMEDEDERTDAKDTGEGDTVSVPPEVDALEDEPNESDEGIQMKPYNSSSLAKDSNV